MATPYFDGHDEVNSNTVASRQGRLASWIVALSFSDGPKTQSLGVWLA